MTNEQLQKLDMLLAGSSNVPRGQLVMLIDEFINDESARKYQQLVNLYNSRVPVRNEDATK